MYNPYSYVCIHIYMYFIVELKQIPEISEYLFKIHYPDTGFELFRKVVNYFKQL